MAPARKKTTRSSAASKKTAAASGAGSRAPAGGRSGSSRSAGSAASASSKQPRRREIAAGICLLLAILSFIGYFDSEPLFISFFTGFVKRFIGYGFFVLPPALVMCSVILAFHKGYPVLLRTIATLSITAVIGSLVHIFATPAGKYTLSFSMLGSLWTDGAKLQSGGIISGSVSELFLVLFGRVGTVITLLIIAAVLVMIAFNATITGLIGAFSNREKLYYEQDYDDDDYDDAGTPIDAEEEERREHRKHKYRYPLIPLWKKKKIDIPLDDKKSSKKDFFDGDPMDELYNKTPGVKTPDEVLDYTPTWETSVQDKDAAPPMAADTPTEMEDMPLDIPFMDGRIKRPPPPPPVVPPIEEVSSPTINLPPDVMSQVIKARNHRMPIVPEPEGADVGEDLGIDADTGADTGAGADIDVPAVAVTEVKPEEVEEPKYAFPPIDLLSRGTAQSRAGSKGVDINSERLEAAFQSFGINVSITNATRGPSVTRYEAELEAGVKLSRLTGLSDDIALALGVVGVRIAAMPNKISTVGIEVPNKNISKVYLRDVIASDTFQRAQSKLTFSIGMDISGDNIIGDISKLPHLLIAGTTGSGKSVCLNSIILSLLYKATPEEVRLIMIDPKMVEFKVYEGIPHLHVPLVTDAKMAAGALQWAVVQMMKRYNLFSEHNARDIAGYNQSIGKNNERQPLPRVVIIIDELADLMLTAAKEVEEAVCRVAQMGRAAGIHLVIATQSPRADVITGLMKANIPSRISFKVASRLESRIILDPGSNADTLIGNGDMLYAPTGSTKPMRVQGTWVSDREREEVVKHIKKISTANYDDEATHEIEKAVYEKSSGGGSGGSGGDSDTDPEHDELLTAAVDVILETGQASVSMLQRRLKLGYARAARIVDQMEEMGIVGPYEGSKPRTLLIDKNQWRQMQYSTGTAPVDRAVAAQIDVPLDENEDDE